MTEAELEVQLQKAKSRIEELESDNYSQDEYITELENDLAAAQKELETMSDTIKDIDNFIFRLKAENLYTEELENFIEYYLKYHNK